MSVDPREPRPIYLRAIPGATAGFELVDPNRESGAYVPLVVARGRLVVDGSVAQGGKVEVGLRFVGESTVGR